MLTSYSPASKPYNTAAIRELIVDAFTAKELYRFCQDDRIFRRIVPRFGPNASLEDMADILVEYCEKQMHFPRLLRKIERHNPRQYKRHHPHLFFNDLAQDEIAREFAPSRASRKRSEITLSVASVLIAILAIVFGLFESEVRQILGLVPRETATETIAPTMLLAETPSSYPSPPATAPSTAIAAAPTETAIHTPTSIPLAATPSPHPEVPEPTATAISVATVTAEPTPGIKVPTALSPYQLLFSTNREGDYDVYLMEMDGSNPRPVLRSAAREMVCDWSPVRQELLYVRGDRPQRELYAVGLDGQSPRPLTRDRRDVANAFWAPDAGSVLISSNSRDGKHYEIWLLDLEAQTERRIPTLSASYGDMAPSWSPDGSQIAFGLLRTRWNIFVMDRDGTNLKQIIQDEPGYEHECPEWSPDGLLLAFMRQRTPGESPRSSEIRMYDLINASWYRVSPQDLFCDTYDWSPDGNWIAYGCEVGDDRYLFIYNIQSGERFQITRRLWDVQGGWKDIAPVWIGP